MERGLYYAGDEVGQFVDLADDVAWAALNLPGQRWSRFYLGSRDDPSAPVVWVVENPPGFTVPEHHHKMHRLEIVLEGSYTLAGRHLGPGAITMFPANQTYGPVVYGPEGGRAMEIFSDSADMVPIFSQMPESDVVDNLTAIFGTAPVISG